MATRKRMSEPIRKSIDNGPRKDLRAQLAEQEKQRQAECAKAIAAVCDRYECDIVPYVTITARGIEGAGFHIRPREPK